MIECHSQGQTEAGSEENAGSLVRVYTLMSERSMLTQPRELMGATPIKPPPG